MNKNIYLLVLALVFLISNKTKAKEQVVEKYNYALSGIILKLIISLEIGSKFGIKTLKDMSLVVI